MKVFSLSHGIGEIINFSKYYDGDKDYIHIKFSNEEFTRVFPINDSEYFRLISSSDHLKQKIENFSLKINDSGNYKSMVYSNGLGIDTELLNLIDIMCNLKDNIILNENENDLLILCIDSLILEVSSALSVSESNAIEIVSEYMNCY